MLALAAWLGYGVERADTASVFAAYGGLFAAYALIVMRRQADWQWWLLVGVALRVLLLFSTPNLSDDIYRFLWDGRLLVAGVHPFAHAPVYFNENHLVPAPGITPELFQKLNSPDYYTVYPPVAQAVFALAAWLSPVGWFGGIVVIRLFLLGCELGVIALLRRAWPGPGPLGATGDRRAALYALNPLAVIEVVGNCHFEGAVVLFMLLGLWALHRQRVGAAAGAWALATAAKLLPLLLVPLVWRWLGGRTGWRFVGLFGIFTALLFLPLFDVEVLRHLAASVGLYFRQFAFNASVFYVLRFGAMAFGWWELVLRAGAVLGALTVLGVLTLTARLKPGVPMPRLAGFLLAALCLHLVDSSTVHPWYVLVPLGVSLLTPWRFPLVWSAVAVLSYSHYSQGGFAENYGVIGLEYGVLLVYFLYELVRVKH